MKVYLLFVLFALSLTSIAYGEAVPEAKNIAPGPWGYDEYYSIGRGVKATENVINIPRGNFSIRFTYRVPAKHNVIRNIFRVTTNDADHG